MTTTTLWRPDGTGVQPGGDIGGDYQVSDAFSVRFVRDDLSVVVDKYWYVELIVDTEVPPAPNDRRYRVTCLMMYTICTDVRDPGGTETWADLAYDNTTDPTIYADYTAAERSAQLLAEVDSRIGAWRIAWDGRSIDRKQLDVPLMGINRKENS